MGKVKGCGDEKCVAHKKKIVYKDSESFCSKCGNSLVYVCKDCKTQMPGDSEKYCVRCLAKRKDRKDKMKKAGGGAVVAGGVLFTGAKKAIGIAAKMKG